MKTENRTPLYNKHLELKATMVDFANYKMPMQYSSIFEETKAVRDSVGIFDTSHMGEIEISGNDSTEFINNLVTLDISKIETYQAKYTTILYQDGGIIDDLIIYKLPDKYLLVVNASNQEKDFEWIIEHKRGNVEIQNKGKEYFQIAVQGPNSLKIIKKLTKEDPSTLRFYHSREENISSIKVLLSRTGYTGEDGFEIYGKPRNAEEIWEKIMKMGEKENICPCGLGARDLLRLEMGYRLYGNDITKETTPLEANLSWIVSMDKKNFIGKDALLKQQKEGISKKLVGISVPGKRIPRTGNKILTKGEEVGTITSGNYSPNINSSIALGYVKKPHDKEDTKVEIAIRNTLIEGKITRLPFWKKGTTRKKIKHK
jgi:aminomethyltransferase